MFGPRISVVAACAVYALFLGPDARSTVSADISCGPVDGPHGDSQPDYLFCVGDGNQGNWTRLQNGTRQLIGRFNRTNVMVTQQGYAMWVGTDQDNRTESYIRQVEDGGANLTIDPGTYFCSIGNETCEIDIYLQLRAYGYSSQNHLELQCRPPSLPEQRPPDGPRKGVRYTYPPFNITWYVNDTLVGHSTNCNGSWCNVTYNYNASFVEHHNVTIRGDTANTTNDGPLCLSCILNTTDGSGINSVCSPATRDPRYYNMSRVGKFGGNLPEAVRGERPDGDPPNRGPHPGGTVILVCSVAIASAFAGLLFVLTRLRRRLGRPRAESGRVVYRPVGGAHGRDGS